MKIASIFKDFVLTYNRTYETEEGESWLRVGPPTAWVGGQEEQKEQRVLSRTTSASHHKFLPSSWTSSHQKDPPLFPI